MGAIAEAQHCPALQLPVGSPGKVGLVEMEFAPVRELTRLVASRHQVPFQVLRAMHYDGGEPAMAYTTVVSPVGGVVQGDRLSLRATVRSGGAAHVTTAAATNLYTMAADYASFEEELCVEAGAYLEYLPDPIIPHRDARYRQSTRLLIHPEGCLVYGETLLPGRIYMDEEVFAYDELDFRLRALRPDGTLLFADHFLLEPKRTSCQRVGRMGNLGTMISFYILCPSAYLTDLRKALTDLQLPALPGTLVGFSELPQASGLMLRGLAPDTVLAAEVTGRVWQAVRQVLRGTPVPEIRKY